MNDNSDLHDFHLGEIIRETAGRQGVAAAALTAVLDPARYCGNEEKLFRVKDMNIRDVLRISHALHYNLLKSVSVAFLAHIPFTGRNVMQAFDAGTLDFRTGRYQFHRNLHNNQKPYNNRKSYNNRKPSINQNPNNYPLIRQNPQSDSAEAMLRFLQDFHLGDYCRDFACAKNMSRQYLAEKIGCEPGSIRYYFRQKDMKVKTAVMLSRALDHNLIAEIYLIRTDFDGMSLFDNCNLCVTMKPNQPFSPENVAEGAFVLSFSPQKSAKKQKKTTKKQPKTTKKSPVP